LVCREIQWVQPKCEFKWSRHNEISPYAEIDRAPGVTTGYCSARVGNFAHTEEFFGYATRCGGRTVVSPHPDPLPRGEGTARDVFCAYCLGNLRRGFRQQTGDHSPSPLG